MLPGVAVADAIVALAAGARSAPTYRPVELPALRHKRSTRTPVALPARCPPSLATARPLSGAGD